MKEKIEAVLKLLPQFQKMLKLVDVLTYKKLYMIFSFAFLSILGVTMWTERTNVIDYTITKITGKEPSWVVSDQTKQFIIQETNKNPNISWMAINEMDLGANAKTLKFWYNDNPDVYNELSHKFDISRSLIFDFDQKHTEQMVSILQNQFICVPFEETTLNNTVPELGAQTKIVCRVAIPPFYGRFVGVLTIGIKNDMSEQEMFEAKGLATTIATTVYWKDVIKLSTK